MSARKIALYEFMPYGAPELIEVAQAYLTRAVNPAAAPSYAVAGDR